MNTVKEFNEMLTSSGYKMLTGNRMKLEIFIDDKTNETGTIHQLEVLPKSIHLKTIMRSDWSDKRGGFETLNHNPVVKIENKRGLKAVLETVEKIRQKYLYEHSQFTNPSQMTITYFGQDI
jgi:hypothetical protein